MDTKMIGDRIKQARILRNYTLDDVASEIGLAKSTIQRYENGLINNPKLPVLQAIADSLRVNPAWISGQDVPMISDDSLSGIINHQLNELGLTLEDVSQKANVPLHWLQKIDTFIPGEWGLEDEEWGYNLITRVADVLGLPGSTLRAALARQEIPLPNDIPILTAEEAFKHAQEGFKEPIEEDNVKLITSKAEQEHIRKYRTIDSKGKHTVDTVLEMEYNRCNKPHLLPSAAHEIEGATDEDIRHDDNLMNDDSIWD